MTERRSGRAKKPINYAKFAGPAENDDDFDEFKTQPKKKAKVVPNEKDQIQAKRTKTEKQAPQTKPEDTQKKVEPLKIRLPLEEKVLQRQINQALEVSKASIVDSDANDEEESDYSNEDSSNDSSSEEKEEVDEENSTNDENDDFAETTSGLSKKKVSSAVSTKSASSKEKPTVVKHTVKKEELQKKDVDRSEKITNILTAAQKTRSPVKNMSKPKTISTCNVPVVINSPIKLPLQGIRLGLSRKVSRKPLHSGVKPQL